MKKLTRIAVAVGLALGTIAPAVATAADQKPNIVVIFGDDIGLWNVGAYTHGMMGKTPNIDRIGKEGILFTDHYAQPSCTAGRAAFITGQMPIRTGMTTIGIPGSTRGIQKEDPTLAEVLKTQGYATGQFGKNHLGDRNEFLPTVHGFDEWFGNLYHLNAEEEPEQLDYPGQKSAAYLQKMGPRGVLHAVAADVDDPAVDPKFGRVGKQKIVNTGPLTRKRMETFDGEVLGHTLNWLDKTAKAKPFFLWFNSTAIHIHSHSPKKYIQMAVDEGRAEEDVVRAKMIEHDEQVGAILKKLEDLGVADNTIVIYTTDNGNELMLWPDGGYAPFRGEKGTTWEGGVRVPFLAKWPGKIKPGSVSNGIQNHEDVFATLAAAAGLPNLKQELLTGKKMGVMNYKVHPRRLQQSRPLDRPEREVRPPRDLLLRRDGPHGPARRRLEDAHRDEEGGQLVEPEVLHQHPVPLQPPDGPPGEDGPGVSRVGHHGPPVLCVQDVGAQLVGPVHCGAHQEHRAVPAAPGG